MLDYDKLFAPGNVIGVKRSGINKIYVISITYDADIDKFNIYRNPNLSSTYNNERFEIEYIIRLDDTGNIKEELFNRSKMPKMPDFKTGMFIKVIDIQSHRSYLGYVNVELDRIIYQDGDWDILSEVITYDGDLFKIFEIYKCDGYNECIRENLIWSI